MSRTLFNACSNGMIAGRLEYCHPKERAELKAAYHRFQNNGVKILFYIPGEHLSGDEGKGGEDGSHPTSLGFIRPAAISAKTPEPLLKPAIKK